MPRRASPLAFALCASLLAPAALAAAPAKAPRGAAQPKARPASEARPPQMSEEPAKPPTATSAPPTGKRAATAPAALAPARPAPPRERRPAPAAGPKDQLAAAAPAPAREANRACAAGLPGPGAQQFDRTRATLREFSWSDMARFFETSLDDNEPQPTQISGPNTLAADDAIRRSGLPRKALEQVARARAVDLLSERELLRLHKALAGASPQAIRALLRADSPTLRAHVWTWLAATPGGVCLLGQLDPGELDAAIRDASVAVEHGEDLVFRPLGDYALAARARLEGAGPQAFDRLLRALWADASLDTRVRALVAGLRVRRGHADSIEEALRDPHAAIRGAAAAAAIARDRARFEARLLQHAAADPADLVTELVVGELLGGPEGVPQGLLARSEDPRITAAIARWRGRGDPMAPLPDPDRPLRFPRPAAAPRDMAPSPGLIDPVPPDTSSGPARETAPPAAAPAPVAEPAAPAAPASPARRLPGVLDDPAESVPAP